MTTGTLLVFGSAFRVRNTSMPSILGSFRSSRISFGVRLPLFSNWPLEKMKSRASTPSLTQTRLFARFFFFSARIVSSASVGLSSTSRISTFSNPVILASCRQREKEGGTFVQLGFGPHPASMAGNQPMNDGKAHPGSGKLLDPVQTLEHAEELVVIAHVEADAVVLDEKSHVIVRVLRGHETHFDLRHCPGRAILECIRQQVHPDL